MQLAYASGRPAVRFLLILDMCRDGFGDNASSRPQVRDPSQDAAPEFWSMCLSTSCGAIASEGDSQHSPFVQELLHSTHGILAESVPLKHGIENACTEMRKKSILLPITMGLERIAVEFCLNQHHRPTSDATSGGERASVQSHQEVTENDVGEHLFDGMSVRRILEHQDAGNHSADEMFEAEASSRKRKLRALQNTTAKRMCTPPPPPNFQRQSVSPQGSSADSQRSTPGRTPEIVSMYVNGDPRRIQEFLQGFIADLYGFSKVQAPRPKWRLCKLVLLAFVRDNIVDMCRGEKADGVEELFQWWQCICDEKREEKLDIEIFSRQVDYALKVTKPSALVGWNFDFQKAASKQYEACIFVLNRKVHEEILRSDFLKEQWEQTVRIERFEPLNTELAETFLDRADIFFEKFVTKFNNPGRVVQYGQLCCLLSHVYARGASRARAMPITAHAAN